LSGGRATWHFSFLATINLIAFHTHFSKVGEAFFEVAVGGRDGEIEGRPIEILGVEAGK
jgi:hypothetical protein